MVLLSLDLGTTVCKAGLFSHRGDLLALRREEYPVISAHRDWAEQDTTVVWEKITRVISEVTGEVPRGETIEALCISAQGEAVVFLDARGRPVRHGILGMDMRSAPEVDALKAKYSERTLYEVSGVPAHPLATAAKVLWVREHQPEVFQRIAHVLCYEEFVFSRLGGVYATDYSLAARTMMFDHRTRQWCPWLLEEVGLRPEQLAQLYPSGTIVGRVDGDRARKLGLPPGVPLVTGGHDVVCAALGTGASKEGQGADMLGTAELFALPVDDFNRSRCLEPPRFACYPHVIADRYAVVTLNQTGGLLLQWFRDQCAADITGRARAAGRDPFEVLVEQARSEPAQSMILPHFVGSGTPWIDPRAKGAIVGLTLHTDTSDLLRSALESVCFDQRLSLEVLDQAGFEVQEVRAVGGQTRARKWLTIRASILNTPIQVLHTSEASLLGAAMLSATAMGVYASLEDAVRNMSRVETTIEPDPAWVTPYDERFKVYRELYPALKDISHELARFE